MTPEELARFMSHVEIVDGHWLWNAYIQPDGYGLFKYQGSMKLTHRVMLAHSLGRELLSGMVACHKPLVCHIRHCCNPEHLREDTSAGNASDRKIDGTEPNRKGSAHTQAKLTDVDIPVIRADPRTLKAIAADYGVSFSLIGQIKNKKVWSHI
jgi:hypothetical protein